MLTHKSVTPLHSPVQRWALSTPCSSPIALQITSVPMASGMKLPRTPIPRRPGAPETLGTARTCPAHRRLYNTTWVGFCTPNGVSAVNNGSGISRLIEDISQALRVPAHTAEAMLASCPQLKRKTAASLASKAAYACDR